jgi:hypothetical protein
VANFKGHAHPLLAACLNPLTTSARAQYDVVCSWSRRPSGAAGVVMFGSPTSTIVEAQSARCARNVLATGQRRGRSDGS